MDLAADQYSYNDHAYRRFIEKIKDAVDVNGIISPGRHGIWPAAYRIGVESASEVGPGAVEVRRSVTNTPVDTI